MNKEIPGPLDYGLSVNRKHVSAETCFIPTTKENN